MKNFEARNGNYEKNAVVKNYRMKQREQRSLGDCWQWETNGQCVKGDNCSFRHDTNKRGKSSPSNPSPNSFMHIRSRLDLIIRSHFGSSTQSERSVLCVLHFHLVLSWPLLSMRRPLCKPSCTALLLGVQHDRWLLLLQAQSYEPIAATTVVTVSFHDYCLFVIVFLICPCIVLRSFRPWFIVSNKKKAGPDYHRLMTMVKRSIDQNLRMNNFEARNGNFETSAVVKNHRVKQREQRSLGDCWQWKPDGQCSK